MKKLLYILTWCIAAFALNTACSNDDTEGVGYYAFGPNPIERGQEISFYGSDITRVNSIIFPDGIEVAAANITVVSNNEIKVRVPMNAETGYITLCFPGGKVTTRSLLTFDEPLVYSALHLYSDLEAKTLDEVKCGERIYITADEGNYFSSLSKVSFRGLDAEYTFDTTLPTDLTDTELIALADEHPCVRNNKLIVVTVPMSAISGKVALEDASENKYTAPDDLTVAQATLTAVVENPITPGDWITLKGADLNLVTSVDFTGWSVTKGEIDEQENSLFELSDDYTTLRILTQKGIGNGVVKLQTLSSVEVVSEFEIKTVMPTKVMVAAADGYKAGKTLKITGTDVDQIASLLFADNVSADIALQADGSAVCTIPATAIDGAVSLVTYAGNSQELIAAMTLAKPTITTLTPSPVDAGAAFTIEGTNLDLVKTVTLGSDELAFTYNTENGAIEATTLVTSQSGTVVLTLENGVTVTSSSALEINAPAVLTVTNLPMNAKPGNSVTLEGFLLNTVERLYLGSTKVLGFTANAEGTTLTFTVPSDLGSGALDVRLFDTSDAECVAGTLNVVTGQTVVEIWSGTFDLGSWANSLQLTDAATLAALATLPADAVFTIELEQSESGAQIQIKNSSWTSLLSANRDAWSATENGVNLADGEASYQFTPDAADFATLQSGGMIIGGKQAIIKHITASYGEPESTTVWEGSAYFSSSWGDNVQIAASEFAEMKSGAKLLITARPNEAASENWYQCQIATLSDWTALDGTEILSISSEGVYTVTLTDTAVSQCKTYGIALKGHEYYLLKVAFQ